MKTPNEPNKDTERGLWRHQTSPIKISPHRRDLSHTPHTDNKRDIWKHQTSPTKTPKEAYEDTKRALHKYLHIIEACDIRLILIIKEPWKNTKRALQRHWKRPMTTPKQANENTKRALYKDLRIVEACDIRRIVIIKEPYEDRKRALQRHWKRPMKTPKERVREREREREREVNKDTKRALFRNLDIVEAFNIGCILIGAALMRGHNSRTLSNISKEAHTDIKRDPYRYQKRPIQI